MSVDVIEGNDTWKTFVDIVHWSINGKLRVITPFIDDFDITNRKVSARIIDIARSNAAVVLMVAPPPEPHSPTRHQNEAKVSCSHCHKAAKKIKLLDLFDRSGSRVLVKEHLHAKVFVGTNQNGQSKLLAGSANLTPYAFFQHCELGFYVTDAGLISSVSKYADMWEAGSRGGRAKIYSIWRSEYLKKYPHLSRITV